jgi:general secretion pathway protein G
MTYTRKAGFSLLEIVIAIALMALAVAVVGPIVMRQFGKGKKKATETALKATQGGIDEFYSDVSAYPAALEDLLKKPADEKLAKGWDGPYLNKNPKDGWNHDLEYQLNPKGSAHPYELYSWGPNGEGSPAEEQISVWDL